MHFKLIAVTVALLSVPALAQVEDKRTFKSDGVTKTVEVLKSGKHLETVTCRQFNALDEHFKPEAIMYAANYGPRGNPHGGQVVEDGVAKFVPAVVKNCRTRPGASFVERVRIAMHRL